MNYFDFFETLVGHEYDFYGVDNNVFCIGLDGKKIALEAIEDPDDGYRSCLKTIEVSLKGNVFFSAPIARVHLERAPEKERAPARRWSGYGKFSGWRLRDATDGHVWLRFGTDNSDDYYPCFTFAYNPRKVELDVNIGGSATTADSERHK